MALGKEENRMEQVIRHIIRNILNEQQPHWWEQNRWGRDLPGPDSFSPGALGSQYMPENSDDTSRWPSSVDYPAFGITAIRKTEDADVWTFISSDSERIGTYRVNPDNLSKSLKKAAEKAFAKWMGFESSFNE
jgi:hypothetical protein